MEITLQAHRVALPRRSRLRLRERIRSGFGHFGQRIASLRVTLKYVNGPRGGRDKMCVLRAALSDGGQVVVIDRSDSLRQALSRCLRRSRRAIDREIKRRYRAARRSRRPTTLAPAL